MITFLTFFLGLVIGPRQFDLAVADTTSRVEIHLDGQLQTEITAPPWTFELDLGDELLPHELSAIAYDDRGSVLGTASQRLNVPHPPVEVAIAIESEDGKVRSARLAWEAAADEALTGVRVRLDGRRLKVDDPTHIPLPDLDLDHFHHLSAEITFKHRLRTQAAVVFGGSFVDQIDAELTAIVVELQHQTESDRLPTPSEIAGWFHRDGTPLSAFAVEKPPVEVMVVRDQKSAKKLAKLVGGLGINRPGTNRPSSTRARLIERRVRDLGIGLEDEDWFRVMATQPEQRPEVGKAIFSASADVLPFVRGLGMGVAGLRIPADDRPERLADAVASSGLEISGGGRRRAVVLVVDPETTDASLLTASGAQLYLTAMRVPLTIWTAGETKVIDQSWGAARDISKPKKLASAVEELEAQLDRQLVIWLRGRLLPSDVELTAEGRRHVTLPRTPLAP